MMQEPQENSDLLSGKTRAEGNGDVRAEAPKLEHSPPDGGFRAYAILVASFLTNGLLFGQINSFSPILTHLKEELKKSGVAGGESRATLVGSLPMGVLFFLSPVSGVLTSLLGLRLTAVLGGLIAATGLILSSFVSHDVNALLFTYGIMYALGASFAYTPSLAILGHYFNKRLGIVNGIVTVGSSVFTVFMPPLMEHMLKNHGLAWLFRLLALFAFGIALCGLLFKPVSLIPKPSREDDTIKSYIKTIISIEIWKNRKYKIWALSMPVALFGYFVPYVHIKGYVTREFTDVHNSNLPIQCIGFASGLGRLIFGWLADRPNVDRILLQQISFYVIGTLTIIMPFAGVFWLVIVISLGMGVFDGAFISLIGPIAFELCGSKFAPQAIGCMLGLAALPISLGPYVAEIIRGTESYRLPFVLAGVSPLVGATLMFAVNYHSRCTGRRSNTKGHIVDSHNLDAEKHPASLLTMNGNKNEQTTL